MKRRSFLGSLPALSVIPAAANAAQPIPEKRDVVLPLYDTKPRHPTCASLREVFRKIQDFVRENPGATVLAADEPGFACIGFAAFVTAGEASLPEKRIHETVVISGLKTGELPEELLGRMRFPDGRHEVAAAMMGGKQLV